MAENRTFAIAGGGLAGAKAAETLREEGFDGRIVIVGAEPERPYERPPLSKAYLAGKAPREEAYVHPEAFYAEHSIELVRGIATGLDPGARRLDLADGTDVGYDRLLLATGAVPRRPPIPGADLDHVHVLRTLADSDALRERFSAGGAVAVIGAGWIGCEVAAAARGHGVDVTLIEAASTPLERVLGPQLGGFFADVHRAHGVRLATNAKVERIEAGRVVLGDGTEAECDTVVLGVGVTPDVRLAEHAGLAVEDGIVVDELLRTSDPDVFAAGDVANALHPLYLRHVRVEHWANALNQGVAAGRSMLDRGEPYVRLPYFFSDQYEVGMEYAGLHSPEDRLELEGTPGKGPFRGYWIAPDGRTTAGMHVDDWGAIDEIKARVESSVTGRG